MHTIVDYMYVTKGPNLDDIYTHLSEQPFLHQKKDQKAQKLVVLLLLVAFDTEQHKEFLVFPLSPFSDNVFSTFYILLIVVCHKKLQNGRGYERLIDFLVVLWVTEIAVQSVGVFRLPAPFLQPYFRRKQMDREFISLAVAFQNDLELRNRIIIKTFCI
jgi:hypothetical protein